MPISTFSYTRISYRFLLCATVFLAGCNADQLFDIQLKRMASQISKKCPVMLNDGIRWDKAEALPGKTFAYTYTLTQVDRKDMDSVQVKKQVTPALIQGIKEEPTLKNFRDHGVTMIYTYKDKNAQPAYTIAITPAMYR